MFDLPSHKTGKVRQTEGYRIAKKVLKAVVTGLKEDGRVEIPGFGVWTVHRFKKSFHYVGLGANRRLEPSAQVRVRFRPYDYLKKFVTAGMTEEEKNAP